jgi:hypothetical protein
LDKEQKAFAKVFGASMPSETVSNKRYNVCPNPSGEGFLCNCMDMQYNHGTWFIFYDDGKDEKKIRGCKHMRRYIEEELGFKVTAFEHV